MHNHNDNYGSRVKLSNGRADKFTAHALDVTPVNSVRSYDTTFSVVKGNLQSLVQCPVCTTHIVMDNPAGITMDILRHSLHRNSLPSLSFAGDTFRPEDACQICEAGEMVAMCVECNQEMCWDCVRIHLKTTATRMHHITGLPDEPKGSLSPQMSRKGYNEPLSVDVKQRPNGIMSDVTRGSPKQTRLKQVRYSDTYQRGNSPRSVSYQKPLDSHHVTPKGSKGNFSIISTFDVGSYVLAMCPASRDQCWVSMTSGISLYNMEGQRLKSIRAHCEVRDMAICKATDVLYLSCFAVKTIKVLDGDDDVKDFLSLSLHPAGITVNSYGDIIICAVEDLRRRYRPEHRNRLLIYSREGNLKREIEHDECGKLFKYPEYIDININGDICVSDIENESLVILREDGRLKVMYQGPPKGSMNNRFDPRDVKCDKEGNIIVCDINNSALHLLDVNGNFDRILISENDGIYWPDILAVDHRNHIWVRELWQQTIKVFQALDSY